MPWVGVPRAVTAIAVDGLTKRFGGVTALRDLSFEVEEGEIYGFLGPNGAGKSTTIDVLLDFVRPTAGSVRVFGMDVQSESTAVRQRTGVLPDGYRVYDRLTGRRHLEFVADSKGVDVDPVAIGERVGIEDALGRTAGGYSKGMAQRLVLGMALVGEPDLLVLDEPTSGLDPNGAREMREIIKRENEAGATVFFSSHVLEQVEAVCDRVGILQDGEMVVEDSVDGLRASLSDDAGLRVVVDDPEAALSAVRDLDGVTRATVAEGELSITCEAGAKLPALNAVERAGVEVRDFETSEASLEDLFADVTGGGRDRASDPEREGSR
jgi:ABC-2 type transport system ATP-binding protein